MAYDIPGKYENEACRPDDKKNPDYISGQFYDESRLLHGHKALPGDIEVVGNEP